MNPLGGRSRFPCSDGSPSRSISRHPGQRRETDCVAGLRGFEPPNVRFFFWAPVSINIEKRCNHYRLIVACMLSGASRDRPVIVGWSTALRGQVINESLGQRPKKLAAGPRLLARTESSRSLCERRSLPVDPDAAKSAPAVDESAMVHLPVLGGLASGHSPWSSGRQASSAGMVASCL